MKHIYRIFNRNSSSNCYRFNSIATLIFRKQLFKVCYTFEYNSNYRYSDSYAPESSDTCYNGTLIPGKGYIYWFNTYPLEYAEFLLDSALARGVYLHTLTSNDAFFKKVCEYDPANDPHAEGGFSIFI